MDIFNKLKTIHHLSHNEEVIKDFILNHPDQAVNLNVNALAKACFVSVSTVYRLCEKLDLSGYAELKLQISTSLDSYLSSRDFDFNYPIRQYQSHYEIMSYLKDDYNKTIGSTFELMDMNELRLVISAMLKAQIIDIYTSAGNISFARNFRFQMAEIGVNVRVPVDEYEQRLYAASSDDSHFAIIVTFGGRGLNIENILTILHRSNTPSLLMSSPDYNNQCDYHLYICNNEDHYNKISSYSTRLSILFLFDLLYTCYFERDYENNIKKKLDYYQKMKTSDQ